MKKLTLAKERPISNWPFLIKKIRVKRYLI